MKALSRQLIATITLIAGCTAAASVGVASSTGATGAAPAITSWQNPFRLHQPPWSPASISGLACADPQFCVAVDTTGNVIVSAHPREGSKAWAATDLSPSDLTSVSCPSRVLCVAPGEGRVYASHNPGAANPVWQSTPLTIRDQDFSGITCPSRNFCAGFPVAEYDPDHGDVVVSTNPGASHPSWRMIRAGSTDIQGLACPAARFCVATATPNRVEFSTSPTRAKTWRSFSAEKASIAIGAISCPTPNFCAAVDGAGGVVLSGRPTGGSAHWHRTVLEANQPLSSIYCWSSHLCLAADMAGNVFSSINPFGGSGTWRQVNLGVTQGLTLKCVSSRICLVADDMGDIFNTDDPTGPLSAWHTNRVDGQLYLQDVSCPSVSLCVASAYDGLIAWSNNPGGGPQAWHTVRLENSKSDGHLTGISCPTISFCVTSDWAGNIFTTTDPTGPASGWNQTQANAPASLAFLRVSCASVNLCLIAGDEQVVSSTSPASGPWQTVTLDIEDPTRVFFDDLSCGSGELCAQTGTVTGAGGRVVVSNSPTGDQSAWASLTVGTAYLDGIECKPDFSCVAVGQNEVDETSDASGGAATWHSYTLPVGQGDLDAVACADVCVASAGSALFVTRDATKGTGWQQTSVAGGPSRISCVGALCVAVDFSGQIFVGHAHS